MQGFLRLRRTHGPKSALRLSTMISTDVFGIDMSNAFIVHKEISTKVSTNVFGIAVVRPRKNRRRHGELENALSLNKKARKPRD